MNRAGQGVVADGDESLVSWRGKLCAHRCSYQVCGLDLISYCHPEKMTVESGRRGPGLEPSCLWHLHSLSKSCEGRPREAGLWPVSQTRYLPTLHLYHNIHGRGPWSEGHMRRSSANRKHSLSLETSIYTYNVECPMRLSVT